MILKFEEFRNENKIGNELDEIRVKNFKIFQERGFPSKKEESWKYTNIKEIIKTNLDNLEIPSKKNNKYNSEWLIKNFVHNKIILLNGNFVESSFEHEDINSIKIKPLVELLKDNKYFKKLKNFFINEKNSLELLNNALVNDGAILEIDKNYSLKQPLIIYNFFDQESENKIINNKFFITLGENSKLSLIEYYKSENKIKYFNNTSHNYRLNKNSILKKYNLNSDIDNSYNYHLTNVVSYSNSLFENFLFFYGSNLLKNEIHCDLVESSSSCFVNGLILLDKKQHHELKTNVNHKYEYCKSSQLVKSVLLDSSNGTYQGKIYVDKNAQKTDGYQLSKALVLSNDSEFNSKPELEIYADDVKCSHGSTTGNIDENSVFYLMSRGLSKSQANKMLIEGFLNESIETITDKNIKELILKIFINRINRVKI